MTPRPLCVDIVLSPSMCAATQPCLQPACHSISTKVFFILEGGGGGGGGGHGETWGSREGV